MGVAGKHDYGLYAVAAHLVLYHFVGAFLPHPDESVAFYDYELLPLAVVPVLAFGDSGPGDVDAHLSAGGGVDELGERAAVVDVHLQVEDGLIFGQIAEIGGKEALGERVGGDFRYHQSGRQGGEPVQEVDNLAEGDVECRGHVAVTAIGLADSLHAVELAVMLAALQGENHLVDEVVDVEELELNGGVIHLDWQPVGNVVAEGGHGGVVVGTAPLAEEVGKAVYEDFCAVFAGIAEEKLFAGFLAFAVGMAGVAAYKRGLNGAAEHHRAGVAVLAQGVEQGRGEAEVALGEVLGVFGTVHAGEVEHEVGLGAVAVEVLGRGVEVVLENLVDGHGVIPGFAFLYVIELGAKVLSNESFSTCN